MQQTEMNGQRIQLTTFYKSVHKFCIPIFQRNYEWKDKQCKALFENLLDISNGKIKEHFLGCITTKKENNYSENIVIVIDGQQRIITLYLLYLAIYNLLKENYNSDNTENTKNTAEKIFDEYLYYKYLISFENKYKITPAKADSDSFLLLLKNKIDFKKRSDSNIIKNYIFFYEELKKNDIFKIYNAIEKLNIISITLGNENPQIIFECLNATGVPLNRADKIRNFLLLQANTSKEQLKAYEDYWLPIENSLIDKFATKEKKSALENFFYHYLICKTNIDSHDSGDCYERIKKYFISFPLSYIEFLQDMKYYAELYESILLKSSTNDYLIDKYLKNIYCLGQINIRPFLLFLLDLYQKKSMSKDSIIGILKILESYLFRKNICNSKQIQVSFFKNIQKEISKNKEKTYKVFKDAFLKQISLNIKYKFPDDKEFELYFKGRKIGSVTNTSERLKLLYLYAKIERFDNKENIDIFETEKKLQIEHIMPQVLSPEWEKDLGENYKKIHETYLNNIGNLTLTGYNQEMGNKSFAYKRSKFLVSNLGINQILARNEQFGLKEIKDRIDFLYTRAVQIWPYPEELLEQKNTEL